MHKTFEIGFKAVTTEQIFAASEPTSTEMAAFCNTLGLSISNQVPILEVLRLTAESTEHPWFVAILARIYSGLREGSSITDALISSLKEIIGIRVEELASQDIRSQPWDPIQPKQYSVPDLFGFFSEFIGMIDAAEESGELDTALFRIRDMNLNGGVINSYESIWGHDVAMFCSLFELVSSAGIPRLKCLEIISRYSPLKSELESVIHEVENNGSTLANAFKQTRGQLAHPALVAIIDAGESSGELEMTLIRIRRE